MTELSRDQKRAAAKRFKREEQERGRQSLPLPAFQMKALFDWVDQQLVDECDHSLRHTQAYLRSQNIPEEPVLQWLEEHGGCCDCEVIANAEEKWEWITGTS